MLATGSDGAYPPYVSEDSIWKTRGMFSYRNIAHLQSIMEYAEKPGIQSCAVMGAGLLGLEAAKAVYDLPTVPDISIMIRGDYPLSRQIDAAAGELVLRKIENMGVRVMARTDPVGIRTRAVRPDENPAYEGEEVFTGFEMKDGSVIESDMVIYAIGIKPRDDLARKVGIKCAKRGGIDVNDYLMTSAEGVYAIGECASWKGNVSLSRLGAKGRRSRHLCADVWPDRARRRDGRHSLLQPHADGRAHPAPHERPRSLHQAQAHGCRRRLVRRLLRR